MIILICLNFYILWSTVSCQRRFQLQYMETYLLESEDASEGQKNLRQRVFRDPRSEQVAERVHAEKCQMAFDRAVEEFNRSRGELFIFCFLKFG